MRFGGIPVNNVWQELYKTVQSRKESHQEGSYTGYLFEKGIDKILKKCGEECSEVIIAAKNGDNAETVLEISDLLYHLTVLMVNQGIRLEDVKAELEKRSKKTGNLKTFHQFDKNS
ncbi:MAG: phosphoribosyl-ATP diphosphatase [Clostridiales bacterium]|nr:phosphoribosyl-ATP diphosphatase [Clostridiales bacterium]